MNSNGTFENVGEIYKALLEGKTIYYALRGKPYGKLVDGRWDSSDGKSYSFDTPQDWGIFEAPKPKQKFYRRKWILAKDIGELRTNPSWYKSIEEFDDKYRWFGEVHSEEIEEREI